MVRRELGAPASHFGSETSLVTVGKTLDFCELLFSWLPLLHKVGFVGFFFLFLTFLESRICIITTVAVTRSIGLSCLLMVSCTNLRMWWQHRLYLCFVSDELLRDEQSATITPFTYC